MPDVAWAFLRRGAKAIVKRRLDLTVEGIEHVPAAGPVILAARHYHHLYDGCAVLATIPRPVHILVGLDWVERRASRMAMDRLCAAARWPVVLRRDGPRPVDPGDAARAWRRAIRESVTLLHEGRVLLVFPEGYPNIDPGYTPKAGDAFLPFQPGVTRLAAMAGSGRQPVPVVPVGIAYIRGPRWRVALRFGQPLVVEDRASEPAALVELERRVHQLSAPY